MNRASIFISSHGRRFRILCAILYWLLVLCLFVRLLFALIPSTMQEFWKRQQEELNADLRAWTESFSDRLSQLPVPFPKTGADRLLPLLEELEPLPCMTGGFYFRYRDGAVLSNSGLPTGHPSMLSPADSSLPYPVTAPYLRSSDGAFVVSFFCSVSPDWMLAADISLESLSEFLAPRQRKDRFFFLIDSRSRRLLTCPDTSLCGLTIAETKEPLLAPFLLAKELPQTALPVKNRHGTTYYTIASANDRSWIQGTYWMLAYYQTPGSLFREMLFHYLDTLSLFLVYLIFAGLIWWRIWLFFKKTHNENTICYMDRNA